MSESPIPIRVAQIVGITTSSAMAGIVGSMSVFVIPRLLEAPTPLMLKQWKNLFEHGAASMPPLAVIAASAYFYLAYYARQLSSGSAKWKLYLTAGLLTVGIVPYTLAIIQPTNKKLTAKYEETKTLSIKDEVVEAGLGEETAHKLVDNWGVLNLGRSFMLIGAGVLGAYTTVF